MSINPQTQIVNMASSSQQPNNENRENLERTQESSSISMSDRTESLYRYNEGFVGTFRNWISRNVLGQKANSTDGSNSTNRERSRNSNMRNRNEENSTHESTRTDINARIARLRGSAPKEPETNQPQAETAPLTGNRPHMAIEANMTQNQQPQVNATMNYNQQPQVNATMNYNQQSYVGADKNTRNNQQNQDNSVVITKVVPSENDIKENEQKQGPKSVNFKQKEEDNLVDITTVLEEARKHFDVLVRSKIQEMGYNEGRVPANFLNESFKFDFDRRNNINNSIFNDERVRHSTGENAAPTPVNLSSNSVQLGNSVAQNMNSVPNNYNTSMYNQNFQEEKIENKSLQQILSENQKLQEKQHEILMKLTERPEKNGQDKNDNKKPNIKVVQDQILSKPPPAYEPCKEQSLVSLLNKNFEKYLKNRFLNDAETRIALLAVFRESQSAEDKVKIILDEYETDTSKKEQRKELYKSIITAIKGQDEEDEIYEKYSENELLFDFFIKLAEVVKHNNQELSTKRVYVKTMKTMLSKETKILNDQDRKYIAIEKERSSQLFDFTDLADIEKFFKSIQKLKKIGLEESVNLISNSFGNSYDNKNNADG